MRKKLILIVCIPIVLFGAYVAFTEVYDVLPDKITAIQEVRREESGGAIVIQEGRSKRVNGHSVSFDFLPVTGSLRFTIDGEDVAVPDEGLLTVGDRKYQIDGWGIRSDSWAALTLQEN